jgi:O-methyltransferase involved in polyketide biosynthesis
MAAEMGYFKDDYSKLFLSHKKKLYPIINRGTWSRVQAYRQTILKFLDFAGDKPCNILSLGGGYDTTFFWLMQNYQRQNLTYIEVDYDRVVEKKIQIINQS